VNVPDSNFPSRETSLPEADWNDPTFSEPQESSTLSTPKSKAPDTWAVPSSDTYTSLPVEILPARNKLPSHMKSLLLLMLIEPVRADAEAKEKPIMGAGPPVMFTFPVKVDTESSAEVYEEALKLVPVQSNLAPPEILPDTSTFPARDDTDNGAAE
jgi:hypothetical protein